jgi:hypothetical protein
MRRRQTALTFPVREWSAAPTADVAETLAKDAHQLVWLLNAHLSAEEEQLVPLMERHITAAEAQEVVAKGGAVGLLPILNRFLWRWA